MNKRHCFSLLTLVYFKRSLTPLCTDIFLKECKYFLFVIKIQCYPYLKLWLIMDTCILSLKTLTLLDKYAITNLFYSIQFYIQYFIPSIPWYHVKIAIIKQWETTETISRNRNHRSNNIYCGKSWKWYIENITWPGRDTFFFYLWVLLVSLRSERSQWVRDTISTRRLFVSPSVHMHVMVCLFYRYWWNFQVKHNFFIHFWNLLLAYHPSNHDETSSHVKDKNSIFMAHDEDMIF